jgi:UDP-2-acetamido-3-amino-2,3-dideoxy-glucuronate N-acetyltransferase
MINKNVRPSLDSMSAAYLVFGNQSLSSNAQYSRSNAIERIPLGVRTSFLVRLPQFKDERGSLIPLDLCSDFLSFVPKRFFYIYDVPCDQLRGGHAHYECSQFLICLHGSVKVYLDDGRWGKNEVLLDCPHIALFIPSMVWATQYYCSPSSYLGVFASHEYDQSDYINEYEAFLHAANG